jgi:hypothetical protein
MTICQETHYFSFDLLGKIASVAAIRTTLAFFLGREIAGLEHVAASEEKEGGRGEAAKGEVAKGEAGRRRKGVAAHAKEE